LAEKLERCPVSNGEGPKEILNIIEKILARASSRKTVAPNEIVEAQIDVAMIHDLTGPLTVNAFREIGSKKVWNPDKIVVIFDHLVPANTVTTAELHKTLREFVKEQGITQFYDVGRGGVCHQVMPEEGFVRPGEVIVGADSHTCEYGALGAFATGIGSTEMAAVFVKGSLWFRVPRALRINANGKFRNHVSAKDLILKIISILGSDGATYKCIEFGGSTISEMSIDGRLTVCNMAIEAGAKAGIVEPDDKTIGYVEARSSMKFYPLRSDSDSEYEKKISIDVSNLPAQVACPPSVDNVKSASEVGDVEIDQAFIGSCTNGRIEDLRVVARLLKGKTVRRGVRMIVIPASQKIYLECLREGLIETFIQAGAAVGNPNCGPCLGGHMGILAPGEVCISTSNRNFTGRMGSPRAKVYLASPATVAASAIEGRIVDPAILGEN
jgi:3-isopropylmalate/(R)-2-methylmalate dehydratase large subunit